MNAADPLLLTLEFLLLICVFIFGYSLSSMINHQPIPGSVIDELCKPHGGFMTFDADGNIRCRDGAYIYRSELKKMGKI